MNQKNTTDQATQTKGQNPQKHDRITIKLT